MSTALLKSPGLRARQDNWFDSPQPLFWIILFTIGLRLITYNGVFGSDDLTYLGSAADVASGTWASSNYNGALRYGFNIPAGIFVWMFGASPFAANLWPLICSVIEVLCVYAMGASIVNRRAGIFAAILLATAPLHMASATRIHADAVVAMFITLSFTLLWFGRLNSDRWLLFACGLSLGGVFWAKELVAVVWLAFLPMLCLFRGRWTSVLYVLLGLALMLVAHGLLMYVLNGHPLHLVLTVLRAVKSNFIDAGGGEDSPFYYFRYIFFDIRHTGLLAFLAALPIILTSRLKASHEASMDGLRFVAFWLISLVVVLSVLPVSLFPLRFVMKQSNYITLFLGPMALMGGLALAAMTKRVASATLALCVLVGVSLGLLQQAQHRAFTSNSKAVGEWLTQEPNAVFVGSTHNMRLSQGWAKLVWPDRPAATLMSFREIEQSPEKYRALIKQATGVFVVLDRETMNWVAGPSPVTQPRPCWGAVVQRISPADLGMGNIFSRWLADAASPLRRLGVPGMDSVAHAFSKLAKPEPADLYKLASPDSACLDR